LPDVVTDFVQGHLTGSNAWTGLQRDDIQAGTRQHVRGNPTRGTKPDEDNVRFRPRL
jgi:hypothetical protein